MTAEMQQHHKPWVITIPVHEPNHTEGPAELREEKPRARSGNWKRLAEEKPE